MLKDKKNFVIALLALLVIIKIPNEGLRFVIWVLAGVFLSLFLDILINNLYAKKRIFPNSAIISGFIVSGILYHGQPLFILAIFLLLAIISKHIIRINNKHIFNPANFALFMAILFKLPLTWTIESNIYLIIIFGLYFAYSYKKFTHIIGFLVFFGVPTLISGVNPFATVSWFFVFIMLIEPKTSGYGLLRGALFGAIAGISAFLIMRYLPGYDPFISALFIANLSNPLLEKIF